MLYVFASLFFKKSSKVYKCYTQSKNTKPNEEKENITYCGEQILLQCRIWLKLLKRYIYNSLWPLTKSTARRIQEYPIKTLRGVGWGVYKRASYDTMKTWFSMSAVLCFQERHDTFQFTVSFYRLTCFGRNLCLSQC